jgi:hypothetical protein
MGTGEQWVAINILQRVAYQTVVLNNALVFQPWNVRDGETPEIIASKYYNNPHYHWIILLANNIFDRNRDWPMSYNDFNADISKRYATPALDGLRVAASTIYQYTDANGDVIDYATWLKTPASQRNAVSIYDWEWQQNESKRAISLVDRAYVAIVDQELNALMQANPLQ